MTVIQADGFEFDFTDALEVFVFDESDKSKPMYHGAPMKGVDIVAEFNDAYVYIELKDYENSSIYDELGAVDEDDLRARRGGFKWLKGYLKYKFRDSFLYRHAENKVDKPIHYICLITFENALNSRMQKELKREIPVGNSPRRWVQSLATSCQVVNVRKWNDNFPKWPVTRIIPAAANEGAPA